MPCPQATSSTQALPFKRVLILGLGLLGGSFGLALQKAGCQGTFWGLDRDEVHLDQALARGLVHQPWDRSGSPEPFDLVFLAVPPSQIPGAVTGLAPWLRPDTLLLDACSVKGPVLASVRAVLGDHPAFVPSHPIAGSHLTGPRSAREDLFRGATVVITPGPETTPLARQGALTLWQSLGAKVREMSPEAHDRTLGLLSHLPQLLAFAYVDQVARAAPDLSLAGTGFRDFTRIAQSSPDLWADIALANRQELLPMLRDMRDQLARLGQALEAEDREALTAAFRRASDLRNAWETR